MLTATNAEPMSAAKRAGVRLRRKPRRPPKCEDERRWLTTYCPERLKIPEPPRQRLAPLALGGAFLVGRAWCRTSPEGEWCEETSPGGHQDDGRGWFRTSPEGEWCEETSPGGHQDDGRGWFRTSDLSRVKCPQGAAVHRQLLPLVPVSGIRA